MTVNHFVNQLVSQVPLVHSSCLEILLLPLTGIDRDHLVDAVDDDQAEVTVAVVVDPLPFVDDLGDIGLAVEASVDHGVHPHQG